MLDRPRAATPLEHPIARDPLGVADRQFGAVHYVNAGFLTTKALQQHAQRHEEARLAGDKTPV